MENLTTDFRSYAVKHHRIAGAYVDHYIGNASRWAPPMAQTPYIVEERQLNVAQMDVFSRLMIDRIIFLGSAVDDHVANIIQAQLLFLQSTDPKKDISLYINSPGGSVYAGLGIYDTMHFISPDVATICTGIALSMGSLLLSGGAAGKRAILPHARVMIHQPSGGTQGVASDMEISVREILKMRDELYQIYAKHTGKTYEEIYTTADRDSWLTAQEAVAFGVVDEVLGASL